MQILKTRLFARFAAYERITDERLREAIKRAERGMIDADLGGGLIKLRVARQAQGRSGGYRRLLAYRANSRAIFLYGFAKNERGNIGPDELLSLHDIAAGWLAADAAKIIRAVEAKVLQEINYDEKDQPIGRRHSRGSRRHAPPWHHGQGHV